MVTFLQLKLSCPGWLYLVDLPSHYEAFSTVLGDRVLEGLMPAIKYFSPHVTEGTSTLNPLASGSHVVPNNSSGAGSIILSCVQRRKELDMGEH